MKILLATTDFIPNVSGIATLSFKHASGLADLGHQVTVLTGPSPAPEETPTFAWVSIPVSKYRPIKIIRLFLALARLIHFTRPDFIWCTNYRGFALPVYTLARFLRLPYGIYLHGTELQTENRSALRRQVFRWISSAAALRCTNSQNSAALLRQLYGLDAQVIPPGVEPADSVPSEIRQQLRAAWFGESAAANGFYLLSACRVSRQKGIGMVLQALAALPSEIQSSIRYILAGTGPDLDEFMQLAQALRLNEQVRFIGPQDRHQLPAIYAACDCCIQPSQPDGDFLESFGISFLEAQAHGLPSIATRWGGIPEAVIPDETALLVSPGSSEEISQAIQFVYSDEEWRARARAKAIEWSRAHSWSAHAAALSAAIGQAMETPTP